jgi:nucleoside 2-deoxyribosyltransferase
VKIYFAGAIRGGRGDRALYLALVDELRRYGEVLTEHVASPELDPIGESGSDAAIHDRDLAWLKEADYLVAEVTTPSLGVGYEIGRATEWNTPVLALFRPSEGKKLSAMIAGSNGVEAREYQEASDAAETIAQYFSVRGGV